MIGVRGLLRVVFFTGLCLFLLESAAAGNKFTTIGGGVSGSPQIKAEHLSIILFVISGVMLLGATLNMFMSHRNPLYMNAVLWKPSAVVMLVIALIALAGGLLV